MRLVLPLPPSANLYWRSIRVGKGCRTVLSSDARAYKALAEVAAMAQVKELLTGPVEVWLVVYFPNKRGDLDNRVKPTFDALQGIAIQNDSQIVAYHVRRETDKDNPRVEITITEGTK